MWSDVGTEIVVETGLAFDFGPLASSIRRLIHDALRDRVDRRVEQQHGQLNSTASLGAPWPPYGLAGSALGLRTVSLGAPWAVRPVRPVRPVRTLRPVQLTVSTSGNIQNGCHVQQKCCSTVGLETLKTACGCCRTASIQNCLSMESAGAG